MCDDMRLALEQLLGDTPYTLEVRDIDLMIEPDAASVLATYDELVPVLFGRLSNGVDHELCHYFLNPSTVAEYVFVMKAAS